MTTAAMRAAFEIHQPLAISGPQYNWTAEEMASYRAANRARMSLLQDSWSHKVLAFRAFYQRPISSITEPLSDEEFQTHHRIIAEEWREFWTALSMDDLVETLDGGLDLIYTVLGLLVARGIPPHIIDAAMEEIHASNMTKADPATGQPILSEAGKILKGPAYVKADLPAAALAATPSFNLLSCPEEKS